ncbi:hypothetical protein [Bradyrhizobium sp. CCBAU 51753]|uniref:hypothetical protein n=1 Tax=Bradyrhizobium sp. CCBAU 51753 TaxID=1325100 RepID=UPI00188A2757|nr:hypothetical protein [Bradyrhizobium sp. CCBAU 51753]
MGFHPQTDEELIPVTREVVDAWKQQTAKLVRRVPLRLDDPEKFGFFDPTTVRPKFGTGGMEAVSMSFTTVPDFIRDPVTNFRS